MDEKPELGQKIRVLFKQMRNVSRHAGGVLITENAEENMPLIKSGGVTQTPWSEGINFRHLEGLGFLKFDLLGLGTLRMFENCIRRILKSEGVKYPTFNQINDWYYKNLHPDNNSMDDMNVYKNVYWKGRWAGIFQFVQPPVQKFVQQMKPTSIIDLATATSVFRPGPLGVNADKLYLKNRTNPEKIQYKHPLLKEVLGPTCGLIVFQEQLQLIYHHLAGVPMDETDGVRKAFTKKDISNKEASLKVIQELKEDFVSRCKSVNNIDESVSGDIFDEIEKYVSYSFNKSHAVSYSINSYMCAWLLTYYPDEWIATYIDYCATEKGGAVAGKDSPLSIALSEARALGYKIGKPDINTSDMDYQVKDKVLIPSFRALKHVGIPAINEIKEYRPYKSIEDLLWNADETWRHSKLNKKGLATLVSLGAFDSMGLVGEDKPIKNYKQLYHIIVDHNEDLKKSCVRKKKPRPKDLLFKLGLEAQSMDDWTTAEKIEASQKLSGTVDLKMIITPEVSKYLETQGIVSIDSWNNEKDYLWAIVKTCRIAKTKTGKEYLRLSLIGEGSEYQCFVWGYNSKKHKIIENYTLVLTRFKKSDFGLSTFYQGIEIITKKE
jgi:DNA polymerase-3 subunit alpha